MSYKDHTVTLGSLGQGRPEPETSDSLTVPDLFGDR